MKKFMAICAAVCMIAVSSTVAQAQDKKQAQPATIKTSPKAEQTVDAVKSTEISAPANKTDNSMRRINMQVERLSNTVKLTDEQKKKVTETYAKFEQESENLRKQINELTKKRDEEVRKMLTPDQINLLDSKKTQLQNLKVEPVKPTKPATTSEPAKLEIK